MSSRRGAGEENILAMLERDSARRTGPRMSGVRLASYGAAAALAGILAGGIAWLAYDNHQGVQELQAQHEVVNEAVPPAMPDAVLPPQAPSAVAAASPIDVPRTVIADDESTRRRDTIVASAVPPLVMLPPHELNGTKPPPTAAAPAQDTGLPKPAKSTLAPAQAPVQKQAQPKNSAQKKSDKTTKPASRPAKPAAAPARTKVAAKAAAKAVGQARSEAARARKAAPNAETPVDSDVALISAIIAHSERHRGERSAAPCSGAKCPPKPARP